MNILLLDGSEQIGPCRYKIQGSRSEHIKCVLRAKSGDPLKVGMLGGGLGTAVLLSVEKNETILECNDFPEPPPAPSDIVPVISLPRPQSFKKTLHFIASSGIKKAYFIMSDGVEKSYWKSSALQPDAIAEELRLGLEQGCDTILPEIVFKHSFPHFLKGEEFQGLCRDARKIIAHPYHTAIPCPGYQSGRTVLAIGPESGYIEPEVEAFTEKGFQPVTLGSHILRVEFALAFACGRLSF